MFSKNIEKTKIIHLYEILIIKYLTRFLWGLLEQPGTGVLK